MATLGSDGVSDVLPSRVEGVGMPIHTVVIVAMGVHLMDNLDLDALATACAEESPLGVPLHGGAARAPARHGLAGQPHRPVLTPVRARRHGAASLPPPAQLAVLLTTGAFRWMDPAEP